MDGTDSLWGGSSVHAESGLRVVTKDGLKWGSGNGWFNFAPMNKASLIQGGCEFVAFLVEFGVGQSELVVDHGSGLGRQFSLPNKLRM